MGEKQQDEFENCMSMVDSLTSSPTASLIAKIQSIQWSFKIFRGNYLELVRPLKMLEETPSAIKLWAKERTKELDSVFEEIGRLLHNFLSSAMMLKDHCTRHVNKLYKGTKHSNFIGEYKTEITRRFVRSANHQVAQGLRNYIQHRTLPAIGSVIRFGENQGLTKVFRVSTKSLLEWEDWKPLARAEIESYGGDFPIRQFAEAYYAEVDSFYRWLWTRQSELHKKEIAEYNAKRARTIVALKQAGMLNDEEIKRLDG